MANVNNVMNTQEKLSWCLSEVDRRLENNRVGPAEEMVGAAIRQTLRWVLDQENTSNPITQMIAARLEDDAAGYLEDVEEPDFRFKEVV